MIEIKTSVQFDVFVDGVPVCFHGKKPKALLALLVYLQGGALNSTDGIYYLYGIESPNSNDKTYYRKCVFSLMETLREYGIEDMIIANRIFKYINMNTITFDVPVDMVIYQKCFKRFEWFERIQID